MSISIFHLAFPVRDLAEAKNFYCDAFGATIGRANPHTVPAARIRVEQIDAPILVAGGDADDVWASGEMAQYIAERRHEAGLETVSLIFSGAGHGLL